MSKLLKKASQDEIDEKSKLSKTVFLEKEVEEGKYEYKQQLINISEERLVHLVSQMKWRLCEGNGEAIYELGVHDDGVPLGLVDSEFEESISTLQEMARRLSAEISLLHEKCVNEENSPRRRVAELLIRQFGEQNYVDLRIAICGNVDAGKSTMIGVLTTGKLDDGRGSARINVFVHKHEIISGRTSSISYQLLGYDSKGRIVNGCDDLRTLGWKEIVEQSSKLITFVDLAGHEKYLKCAVKGMTGSHPDYASLMIGANNGISGMTKEHFALCLHLRITVFVVITKIDICPEHVLQNTLKKLKRILELPGVRKIPYIVESRSDVTTCAKNMASGNICPIFLVSNVTGKNLDLLKQFLNLLPVRKDWNDLKKETAQFMIDQTFYVTGIGCVVSGMMLQGELSLHDTVMLGPDSVGQFREVQIKGIHVKRTPVKNASAGQIASLALRKVRRCDVRQGMVVVEEKNPQAVWEFECEVFCHYIHKTTIKLNYQPVIHTLAVKQSARIIWMDKESIRSGERAIAKFRFLYKPEYLKVRTRIVFREGRTKGVGRITKIFLPRKKGSEGINNDNDDDDDENDESKKYSNNWKKKKKKRKKMKEQEKKKSKNN